MRLREFSKYRNELMGIAIISIMIFHYCENVLSHYGAGIHYTAGYWYNMIIGSIGVEIFLFTSGMGLYFSMKKGGSNDIIGFYKKRFVRVLIPYLLYGAVAWFIIDVILLEKSVAFFIYDLSSLGFWFSGIKTIWFVPFIIAMYMVFPLIYNVLEQKNGVFKIFVLIAATIFILECFRFSNSEAYSNTSIALTRIPIFVLGVYFGKKIYDDETISFNQYGIFISGIAVGFINFFFEYMHDSGCAEEGIIKVIYMCFRHFDRYMNAWYSLGVMFVVIWALHKTGNSLKTLNKLICAAGAISFELYMTHVTIRRMFDVAELPIWLFRYFGTVIIVSVIISVALSKINDSIKAAMLQ